MVASKLVPNSLAKLKVETLLDAAHLKYHIIYRGYRVNHLAHALCALYNLGANSAQIQSYHDTYVAERSLEPLRAPKFTVDEATWMDCIPNEDAYPELLEFFDKQIASLGIQKSVEKYLPKLMTQLHTDIFHPLIHIGYGIEYNLPKVLAEGFAYACLKPGKTGELIDRLPENTNTETWTLLNILDDLKRKNMPQPESFPKIQEFLAKNEDVTRSIFLRWKCDNVDDETEQKSRLDELTLVSILVFFGSYRGPEPTMDFFLAHAVTGIHAVRVIFPVLSVSERTRLLRIFVMCFLGTYWFQGSPEFNEATIFKYPSKNLVWDDILTHTLASSDAHVIKVVQALHALKQESALDPSISSKLLDHSANMIVDLTKAGDIFESHN